jgi:thiol-disulfide isomerase/thioredoxin
MKKIITTLDELKEHLSKSASAIVKFETPWCGVCKASEPVTRPVFEKYESKIDILVVDADATHAWAEDGNTDFGIHLVPTYMTYKNNKLIWRQDNFVPAQEIEKQILEVI